MIADEWAELASARYIPALKVGEWSDMASDLAPLVRIFYLPLLQVLQIMVVVPVEVEEVIKNEFF